MLYYFSDRSVETIDDLRIATIYQWEKKFSLSIANREFELLERIGTRYIVAIWIWLTLIYFHLFLVSLIFIYVLAGIIILNLYSFFLPSQFLSLYIPNKYKINRNFDEVLCSNKKKYTHRQLYRICSKKLSTGYYDNRMRSKATTMCRDSCLLSACRTHIADEIGVYLQCILVLYMIYGMVNFYI